MVFSAYVNSSTVIMDRIEYNWKMEAPLDPHTYKIKKTDLNPGIEKRSTQLIKKTDWLQMAEICPPRH